MLKRKCHLVSMERHSWRQERHSSFKDRVFPLEAPFVASKRLLFVEGERCLREKKVRSRTSLAAPIALGGMGTISLRGGRRFSEGGDPLHSQRSEPSAKFRAHPEQPPADAGGTDAELRGDLLERHSVGLALENLLPVPALAHHARAPWSSPRRREERLRGFVFFRKIDIAVGRSSVRVARTGDYVELMASLAANSIVVRYAIPDAPDGGGIDARSVTGVRQAEAEMAAID